MDSFAVFIALLRFLPSLLVLAACQIGFSEPCLPFGSSMLGQVPP
jgi:hypothetical protein